MCTLFSRVLHEKFVQHEEGEDEVPTIQRENDEWGFRKTSMVHITGRIVLNAWRLMKGEFDLTSYTLENMVYHVLHER